MKLPSKDSTVWRTIVTVVQFLAGAGLAYAVSPEFREVVQKCWNDILVALSASTGLAAAVWNFFRKDVENF